MLGFLTDLREFGFLQNALITGVLASVACGFIGTYVVVKRITYIAGGISHAILGGMGAAFYIQKTYDWEAMNPLYGGVASAILVALLIGWVSLKARQREDTVIGALWSVGMAAGILFIARSPGYSTDLMSYLFGNILMVSSQDLWLLAALDCIVIVVSIVFHKQFLAVCFDEEFAHVRGVRVAFYYLLLLCLTALTVVVLVTVVGIVMVIALLTLPAAVAAFYSRSLRTMMVLSTVLCMVFTTLGLAVSYGPNLPAGATTILIAGVAYLGALVSSGLGNRHRAG